MCSGPPTSLLQPVTLPQGTPEQQAEMAALKLRITKVRAETERLQMRLHILRNEVQRLLEIAKEARAFQERNTVRILSHSTDRQ